MLDRDQTTDSAAINHNTPPATEEQIRVWRSDSNTYVAQLWVGDRYATASRSSEQAARDALPWVIYDMHAQDGCIKPHCLPSAVREAVAKRSAIMADLTRAELIKLTALHLDFVLASGDEAPAAYVMSPLEVAAHCIHRGGELADTDPALMPNVLCFYHAEITALEYNAKQLKSVCNERDAEEYQAKADALKAVLARNGFGWRSDPDNNNG